MDFFSSTNFPRQKKLWKNCGNGFPVKIIHSNVAFLHLFEGLKQKTVFWRVCVSPAGVPSYYFNPIPPASATTKKQKNKTGGWPVGIPSYYNFICFFQHVIFILTTIYSIYNIILLFLFFAGK